MNDAKARVNSRREGQKTGAVPEEWNGPKWVYRFTLRRTLDED